LLFIASLPQLDPALDTDPNVLAKITDIIKASSHYAILSLENTLDALRKLFDSQATTKTIRNDRESPLQKPRYTENCYRMFQWHIHGA